MIAQDKETGFAIVAVLGLSACSGPVTYQTSIELARQDTQIEREAVIATVRAFLGNDFPKDGEDGPLNGDDVFSSDTLERRKSTALALKVKARAPLQGKFSIVGDIAVSAGRGTYDLPNGTEVLTDPAVVNVTSRAVRGSVGLAHTTDFGNGISGEFLAGLGLGIARSNTSINSALLDVSESSTDGSQFVYIGTNLSYAPDNSTSGVDVVFVDGRVKRYTSGAYDLRIAVGAGIRH